MSRPIRLLDVYVASEGAALFRHLLDADDDFVRERLENIGAFLSKADDPAYATGVVVPELGVEEGYASWSAVYDTMANALIRAEEPIVRATFSGLSPARGLDAACGTGRHAAWLADAGHEIVGIDRTEAMLAIARQKVPGAIFRVGDIDQLPFDDGEFDFAVCALALTHLVDPSVAIGELARVVRPGGIVVLTDAHPTFVLLQGQAQFPTPKGMAYVRNHAHLHGTYLRAFVAAGLEVRNVEEPTIEMDFGHGLQAPVADALRALWQDIPVALVWTLSTQRGDGDD
jgi:ubiquinone/menaquinone biosynthesis C-methylase UbiE